MKKSLRMSRWYTVCPSDIQCESNIDGPFSNVWQRSCLSPTLKKLWTRVKLDIVEYGVRFGASGIFGVAGSESELHFAIATIGNPVPVRKNWIRLEYGPNTRKHWPNAAVCGLNLDCPSKFGLNSDCSSELELNSELQLEYRPNLGRIQTDFNRIRQFRPLQPNPARI